MSTDGKYISTIKTSKASDSHAYLMPTSCHPAHICKNIPKGVMKRIKRNCSNVTDCESMYSDYSQYLYSRGYSEDIVGYAISQARETPREDLLGISGYSTPESTIRKYPLIMKFNPMLPPIAKYIRENLHILKLTPETNKLFNSDSIFVSYKIEANIKSLISKNRYVTKSDNIVSGPSDIPSVPGDAGCVRF